MTAYTNVDTLPDLRPTIAELLDGLALHACADGWCRVEAAYQRGADTLRWSAGREAPDLEELRNELGLISVKLDEQADALSKIEDLAIAQLSETAITMATFRDAVLRVIRDA